MANRTLFKIYSDGNIVAYFYCNDSYRQYAHRISETILLYISAIPSCQYSRNDERGTYSAFVPASHRPVLRSLENSIHIHKQDMDAVVDKWSTGGSDISHQFRTFGQYYDSFRIYEDRKREVIRQLTNVLLSLVKDELHLADANISIKKLDVETLVAEVHIICKSILVVYNMSFRKNCYVKETFGRLRDMFDRFN